MNEIEKAKCDMCGIITEVQREYYHYDINCECHLPNHFEIVRYCKNCFPKEPKFRFRKIQMACLSKNDVI